MWPLVWCSGRVELVYPGQAAGVSVATAPSFLQTKQDNTSLPATRTNPSLADIGSGSGTLGGASTVPSNIRDDTKSSASELWGSAPSYLLCRPRISITLDRKPQIATNKANWAALRGTVVHITLLPIYILHFPHHFLWLC